MRFADTNVLMYAINPDPAEDDKRQRALRVLAGPGLTLSVQVLQEFYWQSTRPGRLGALSHAGALTFLEALRHLPVQLITLQVFNLALDLCDRFRLSYWDSAILAAARVSGCDTVLSEDLSHDQDYDGIHVVNPFVDLLRAS